MAFWASLVAQRSWLAGLVRLGKSTTCAWSSSLLHIKWGKKLSSWLWWFRCQSTSVLQINYSMPSTSSCQFHSKIWPLCLIFLLFSSLSSSTPPSMVTLVINHQSQHALPLTAVVLASQLATPFGTKVNSLSTVDIQASISLA
uniref:Secreted protein n=1 Tax=Salix viminalis TaxID=40686 RepID=A0A6N2MT82_SALVM